MQQTLSLSRGYFAVSIISLSTSTNFLSSVGRWSDDGVVEYNQINEWLARRELGKLPVAKISPIIFLLTLTLASCSSAYRPLVGKVTLDGQPLEGVTVYFTLEDEELPVGMAITRSGGQFHMTRMSSTQPIPAGEYKVVVVQVGYDSQHENSSLTVPPIYSDVSTTPFLVKVPLQHELLLELNHDES